MAPKIAKRNAPVADGQAAAGASAPPDAAAVPTAKQQRPKPKKAAPPAGAAPQASPNSPATTSKAAPASKTTAGATPAGSKKLVVRGLPFTWTRADFVARLRASAAVKRAFPANLTADGANVDDGDDGACGIGAIILWFQPGTRPVAATGGAVATGSAPGWATVRVAAAGTGEAEAEAIAATFDGVGLDKAACPKLVATVEYSNNQILTLAPASSPTPVAPAAAKGAKKKPGHQQPQHSALYTADKEFVDFVAAFEAARVKRAEHDVTRGATDASDELEVWTQAMKRSEDDAKKPTPLVEAVVANWFNGQAFPWEQEKKRLQQQRALDKRKAKKKGKGKFAADSDDDEAAAGGGGGGSTAESRRIEKRRAKREAAREAAAGTTAKKSKKAEKKAAKKAAAAAASSAASSSLSVEKQLLKKADKEHKKESKIAEKAALKERRKQEKQMIKERKAERAARKAEKASVKAEKEGKQRVLAELSAAMTGKSATVSPSAAGAGTGAKRGGGTKAGPAPKSAAAPPSGFTVSTTRDTLKAAGGKGNNKKPQHADPDADMVAPSAGKGPAAAPKKSAAKPPAPKIAKRAAAPPVAAAAAPARELAEW